MKKTLVSALTTALVVGAASTTFAAANPFEDVPADHWAYDAIAQLAADGVIEGYGDGTYRGDQEITRYEMAQMVARAMAKGNGVDKAMIDKLAAEFADELNSLGVRVTALEKKVDNVKWYGLFRYTYNRAREENVMNNHRNTNDFRLRLQMAANINAHWTGYGRVEYKSNMADAQNTTGVSHGGSDLFLNRAYVEGIYGPLTIDLGRFPYFTDVDSGMVFDDEFDGGMIKYGDKANVKIMIGRYHDNYSDGDLPFGSAAGDPIRTASYQGIEINSDPNQKFTVGAAYHHFANTDVLTAHTLGAIGKAYGDDALSLWEVGLGYRFDNNFKLSSAYAKNTSGDVPSKHLQSWHVTMNYKGADPKVQGSWGSYLSYRHLGYYATIMPTYNTGNPGAKGWQLGIQYTLFPNVLTTFEYWLGKNMLNDDARQDTIFARAEIFF